jgi:hypothetical protein
MRLKRVKDLDRVPGPHQLVVQRQPVVAGSFQADCRWLVQVLQVVQQGTHAESRVAEAAWLADLLAILAHEARLVRTFGDIDSNGDHYRDLPSKLEAGRVPDVRESSTALCVKRGGLAFHNLLIRGRSRSGAAAFLTKPKYFKEGGAAPAPLEHNPTPWSTG